MLEMFSLVLFPIAHNDHKHKVDCSHKAFNYKTWHWPTGTLLSILNILI